MAILLICVAWFLLIFFWWQADIVGNFLAGFGSPTGPVHVNDITGAPQRPNTEDRDFLIGVVLTIFVILSTYIILKSGLHKSTIIFYAVTLVLLLSAIFLVWFTELNYEKAYDNFITANPPKTLEQMESEHPLIGKIPRTYIIKGEGDKRYVSIAANGAAFYVEHSYNGYGDFYITVYPAGKVIGKNFHVLSELALPSEENGTHSYDLYFNSNGTSMLEDFDFVYLENLKRSDFEIEPYKSYMDPFTLEYLK
jgi:hypothetical protein